MKLIWPVLLGIFRALYLCYSWWCRLFLPALLGVLALSMGLLAGAYPLSRTVSLWILALLALLAALAVIGVYWRRTSDDPNPWQSGFLAWFGTLKLFKNAGGSPAVKLHWPSSYLVENPRGYRISGASMRDILNQLQPGDILLRGYEGYVDGEFIRRSSLSSQNGFKPGWFTHVALYVGELTPADRAQVPAAFRDDPGYFSLGPQMVIHSMAKGVHTEDILTFLRCEFHPSSAWWSASPRISGRAANRLTRPRYRTKWSRTSCKSCRPVKPFRAIVQCWQPVNRPSKKSVKAMILIAVTPRNSTALAAQSCCTTACAGCWQRLI